MQTRFSVQLDREAPQHVTRYSLYHIELQTVKLSAIRDFQGMTIGEWLAVSLNRSKDRLGDRKITCLSCPEPSSRSSLQC